MESTVNVTSICLGELSECYRSECRCSTGSIERLDSRKCIPVVNNLGSPFEDDRQCQSGIPVRLSVCGGPDPQNKTCACAEGAVNPPCEDQCLIAAGRLGDSCIQDVQCQLRLGLKSKCVRNRCICDEGKSSKNLVATSPNKVNP